MSDTRGRSIRVAIIGGGAAGTLAAVHLLREAGRYGSLDIELIDRDGSFGPGVAYGSKDPLHLLNVPAVRMGGLSGKPEDFYEWLRRRGDDPGEADFVPRIAYGEYLEQLLAEAEVRAPGSELLRRTDEVLSVGSREPSRMAPLKLGLRRAGTLEADRVVLALGPLGGDDPVPVPEELRASGVYVSHPWAPGALDHIRGERVLIVGTGLTMVDVALTLCGGDEKTTVLAVSRHGLLPRTHRRDLTRIQRFPVPLDEGELAPIVAAVLGRIARATQERGDWRDVIDSMRPMTPGIWASLRLEEKRRFLSDLHRFWEVHRFRMAPESASRLEALQAASRLRCGAGSIVALEPRGTGARVSLRAPGSEVEITDVDRVVNCSGAGGNLTAQAPPVLASLLASGTARPDELGLGLDVDGRGALIAADGSASERIYAIGALRKGVEWEAIGITEIREQAAIAAARIAAGERRAAPGSPALVQAPPPAGPGEALGESAA